MKALRIARCNINGCILAVYPSIEAAVEAMEAMGEPIAQRSISSAIKGPQKTAGGYVWREYYSRHGVRQIDKDGNATDYESIADAARLTGISYTNIWRAIKGHTQGNVSSGFTWKAIGEDNAEPAKGRAIVCKDLRTGEVFHFPTTRQAAIAIAGNPKAASMITRVARHRKRARTAYGCLWKYDEGNGADSEE